MSDVIFSIEPRLPPAVCGTSGFGWQLSQHWPDATKKFTHLTVDGAEASRRHFGRQEIFETGQSASRLFARLQEHPGAGVIVQYSSRGYHRYGIPIWLARGLGKWRRANAASRMLVFFHEVPQPLPLLTRHGILERINRAIIRRLCRYADVIATNTGEHAERLGEITGRREVPCLPIPSNIPAPGNVDASFAGRAAGDFAVFGLPLTLLLTLQHFAAELAEWREAGVLERLHLIGPPDEKFSRQTDALLAGILPAEAIVRHGALDAAQVSEVFSRAGFFLTQSNEGNFSKSGTFAAFASHACAVVSKMRTHGEPFAHLVQPSEVVPALQRKDFAEFERRARALREWYLRESDWPAVAGGIERLFRGGA